MEVDEKSLKFEEKKKTLSESFSTYFKLMREGNSFKDSFAIFVYMLEIPIRMLKRSFNIHPKPKLVYNVTIKNKDGIFFCGDSWLMTQGAISDYEIGLKKYFDLKKGVFVDVGANIGKYSVIIGRQLKDKGKVISIEASEDIFKILKKNIELNNLQNVIPLNLAVSDKKGISEFYLANKGLGTASSLFEIKEHSKKVKVKTDTLDGIIKDLEIKKIDLIKIDVEGAEPRVLRGALDILKKDKPKVVFEALNKERFDECKKILKKFNYKIRRLGPIDFIAEVKNK